MLLCVQERVCCWLEMAEGVVFGGYWVCCGRSELGVSDRESFVAQADGQSFIGGSLVMTRRLHRGTWL